MRLLNNKKLFGTSAKKKFYFGHILRLYLKLYFENEEGRWCPGSTGKLKKKHVFS